MWLFWTPLVLLGFDVQLVLAVVAINLAFQFFVHTRWGANWGVLGLVLNTPAWHRVHHACNPLYIDKNYAGVLVIWDRLFGTFQPEVAEVPCVYGITEDFESVNPLTITFYEWRRMWQELRQPQSAGGKSILQTLFGPPKGRTDPASDSEVGGQLHD
jgi:sterol desaturase/sphingolipid hydroxylase (fatty acid hydroxylase superfamily)